MMLSVPNCTTLFCSFTGKCCVLYFDKRLGAVHSKHCQNMLFQIFARKCKYQKDGKHMFWGLAPKRCSSNSFPEKHIFICKKHIF